MNKKILVVSVLAVLMLVTITYASAISSNTTPAKKKESPLFGIRTRQAIGEKIQALKARFVGERAFWIPFQWLKDDLSEGKGLNWTYGKECITQDSVCPTSRTCHCLNR